MQKHQGVWAAGGSAQVKEEPAQRAGDTEQNALPPRLLAIANTVRILHNTFGPAPEVAVILGSGWAAATQQLGQAQRMAYDVQQIETKFAAQYKSIDLTQPQRVLVQGAQDRWQNSVAAFEDALKVQAGAVGNIEGARTSIVQLVTASQSATGALQAAQAGNQLLALQSQQLTDLTATIASLGRAQSLDAANAAAAKAQAREQLRRFLAPGRGYVPTPAQMFRN